MEASASETSLRAKLHKVSPRTSPHMRGPGPDTVGHARGTGNQDTQVKYPYPHAVDANANGLLGLGVPAGYAGPLPGGHAGPAVGGANHRARPQPTGAAASQFNLPHVGKGHTPVNSQTRMSINRKSLREIPPDDVRLSQVRHIV